MARTTKKGDAAPRGRGRPALEAGEPTVPVTIRMVGAQRDKLVRLGGAVGGGAAWVRQRIDKAPEPKE